MHNDGDFVDVILQCVESLMMMRKGFGSGRDPVEERSLHLPGQKLLASGPTFIQRAPEYQLTMLTLRQPVTSMKFKHSYYNVKDKGSCLLPPLQVCGQMDVKLYALLTQSRIAITEKTFIFKYLVIIFSRRAITLEHDSSVSMVIRLQDSLSRNGLSTRDLSPSKVVRSSETYQPRTQ